MRKNNYDDYYYQKETKVVYDEYGMPLSELVAGHCYNNCGSIAIALQIIVKECKNFLQIPGDVFVANKICFLGLSDSLSFALW